MHIFRNTQTQRYGSFYQRTRDLKKYFSDSKKWPQMGHFLTTPVLRALTGEAFKRLNLQPDTYPAVELYNEIQKLVKISFQLWKPADQTPLCHICTPTVSGPCSPWYLFYSSFFCICGICIFVFVHLHSWVFVLL